MVLDDIKIQDQLYFPTYHLSHDANEVAVKEYELSASTLAAEEKILNMSTSLLVGLIGVVAAFLNSGPDTIEKYVKIGLNTPSASLAFLVIFLLITVSLASYFADARRSVVNASRKIIILRRMLGLSYGGIELVLPSNRLDGANEPYHIRMFHGWLSPKSIPIYCVSISSAVVLYLVSPSLSVHFPSFISQLSTIETTSAILAVTWCLAVLLFYRLHLMDQYESFIRICALQMAALIRQPVIQNFEYIIYRARLAVFEAERLRIPVRKFHPILIELEDRTFKKHLGVSIRGIVAAGHRYFKRGKKSGGSTITQQIVRTLFIRNLRNNIQRKFVEIILALWFDRMFSKEQIADLYICSVRYEKQINGIAEACKYFFPEESLSDINNSKIFFLVERVSNIRSKLIVDKVAANLKNLHGKSILSQSDVDRVIEIFRQQMNARKVLTTTEEIDSLAQKVTNLGDVPV